MPAKHMHPHAPAHAHPYTDAHHACARAHGPSAVMPTIATCTRDFVPLGVAWPGACSDQCMLFFVHAAFATLALHAHRLKAIGEHASYACKYEPCAHGGAIKAHAPKAHAAHEQVPCPCNKAHSTLLHSRPFARWALGPPCIPCRQSPHAPMLRPMQSFNSPLDVFRQPQATSTCFCIPGPWLPMGMFPLSAVNDTMCINSHQASCSTLTHGKHM